MNEQLYGLTRDNLLRMLPEALARDEGMSTATDPSLARAR